MQSTQFLKISKFDCNVMNPFDDLALCLVVTSVSWKLHIIQIF